MHTSGEKAGGERGHGRGRAFRNHGGDGPGASRNAQWQGEPPLALPPLEHLTCPQLEAPACPGKGASWTQNKTTKGAGTGSSGRSPHRGRQPSEGKGLVAAGEAQNYGCQPFGKQELNPKAISFHKSGHLKDATLFYIFITFY